MQRKLRKDQECVRAALETLDRAARSFNGADKRRSKRYAYRSCRLDLDIVRPDGTVVQYAAASRDISSSGATFIVGQFVYPGSAAVVNLVTVHNQRHRVGSKVVRCRYLTGTANLHEVAVAFDNPVDVALFNRAALSLQVLMVDDDQMMHAIAGRFLDSLNVHLVQALSAAEARAAVEKSPHFDLLVVDGVLTDGSGAALVRELRESGYFRPIIGVSATDNDQTRQEFLQAGCSMFVPKPVSRETLLQAVHALIDEPLVSTLIHEPGMVDLIDTFVDHLAARVREIETLFREQAMDALRDAARTLKGQAASIGFDVISAAAAKVEAQAGSGGEARLVRDALNELVRWCVSARRASCSPAYRAGESPER